MGILDVESVSMRFGGNMALQDVTIDVTSGCVTGLIGPNGAGKTTLFNVITGLLQPTRGRITLNGKDVTKAPTHERARKGLARTFQRLELFGSLTARENLQVAGEIRRGVDGESRSVAERVDEVVAKVGMQGFIDVRADNLTTGQARLVELGRALMKGPKVLLLDEPASGLDADETESFAELLTELAASGVALLLVEHDMPLVMRTCTRIHVLDYGKIIASGTGEEIRNNQAVIDAYLGPTAEVA